MARGAALVRQWKLLMALQSRRMGICLDDLADIVGYHRRTVQRDLQVLREAGFPLQYETDDFGKRFWRVPREVLERQSILLSVGEAISLYLARQMLAPLSGTLLADGLESLIGKIRSALPGEALAHFAGLGEVMMVRAPSRADYRKYAGQLRVLSEAARGEQAVRIRYRGAWRAEEYETTIHPYGIVLYEADVYVVAYSLRAKGMRVFKVSRIRQAEPTGQRFRRPADFSLEQVFAGSFGIMHARPERPIEIVCRFEGPLATVVAERQWHGSQRLERQPDGSLLMRFELSETVEFVRWIKGLGPRAVVVEPRWLREQIRRELLAAAEKYKNS